MTVDAISKVRTFLIRGLAVAAVVTAYAFSGVGATVAGVVGVTGLTLFTTAKPAEAGGYHNPHRRHRRGPSRGRGRGR
jgi:hypothetical protein